ncbi:hypothetical protein HIM_11268 [Hirsutella minnesotensis 3608]|uniref:FAD-binding FR-type domain-containing protein n=1 Tax=Hirsutella minnesotensis 3608 TaxID=1043627 RepID=A0A0F7ZFL4_9HYPO|nr:hypothetical protein HIM_11268 [Hirsutella minnesotensis 3608]
MLSVGMTTFHEGEKAVRQMLKVPPSENPTSTGLPGRYAARVALSPLVAIGTLDGQGRPWTTIWGGRRGFATAVAPGVLGLKSGVDHRHDPVFAALWDGTDPDAGDGVVQPPDGGKMMAALAIDLETRDRVKLAGVMAAGSVSREDEDDKDAAPTEHSDGTGSRSVQAAFVITESIGNCPKYINKKQIKPRTPLDARIVSDELPLPDEALALLAKADMLFVSSTNGLTMDTNHRGGTSGFIRVVRNGPDGVAIAYPEYSGNRLYQTLGNLRVNPLIGIVVPDYDTSDVLYLTGSASVLVGEQASSLMARTNLAVVVSVAAARFVRGGLPFCGAGGEPSPYNPPLRHLLSERTPHVGAADASSSSRPDMTATLVGREMVTPTIGVFTFQLSSRADAQTTATATWRPGQHVTLDFEPELGTGYAHMCDDDPQSLNDDLKRTFTVSSEPGARLDVKPDVLRSSVATFQITARRHGPATGLLWRHNLAAPLELPVLGFGGEESFRLPTVPESARRPVFVAGGVGVTPLLAQARGVLARGVDLEVLWTLRGEDLPLALRVLKEIPALADKMQLFVTGQALDGLETRESIKATGVAMRQRRMDAKDVSNFKGRGTSFYLCAGPDLLRRLQQWLEGDTFVSEDFGY